ncbi:MAG: ChaN family lipoprotein [Desulfobacterales bacterium]
MIIMRKLVFVLMICMPVTSWSANLHYALDVHINPAERKITGTGRLKADTPMSIGLSVRDLRELKIDGNDAPRTADENIQLTIKSGKEIMISYEAVFPEKGINFIDENHVFLIDDWYPLPDDLVEYALTVTLPENFIATSESESVTVQKHGKTETFVFQFNYPLDGLHLAASTRYILKKDRYNDIVLEAYFFEEDAHLADAYIARTKKYLAMYEKMLTPYPYKRFAIVENILPTGYSMPTFTLLGSQVVNLPFIVQTSLGHEILHQWFGNSVYIDFGPGNWAEGITTYLADHQYAALESEDTAYRKKILVDYNAYVNADNTIPLSGFKSSSDKAQSAIGYGKAAMFFHVLRKRYGDRSFFAALQEFIQQNRFRNASWHDIQRAFEKVTGEELYTYFGDWLTRKNIPRLTVENAQLYVAQGKLKLNFDLFQQDGSYPLSIPITLHTNSGKSMRTVDVTTPKEKISLLLEESPNTVVIDENYDLMRQLAPEEIPPVLAGIMGKKKLTAVISSLQRSTYQPLIDALGVENITYVTPEKFSFVQMKENSMLIAGYDNSFVDMLFGKQIVPEDGIRLKIYKNPYNPSERIALLHAKNKTEAQAVQRKIPHYGKYTELAFDEGRNTFKSIAETDNGILVLSHPPTSAVTPDSLATVDDIISQLTTARIIYVGEQHERFAHHINQLQIIKKMHEAGYTLAVGMEMFQKPFQPVVNEYLAGRIDEHKFVQKSEYFSRWGYDYNLYKPIIDYLKQQNIPLIALNIQGDISRKVAREGLYSLPDDQKKQLPSAMDFSNEQYQEDLNNVFKLHTQQKELKDFNYFFQAQTLWDEGMAESAQKFLANNPESKLVILAGNGHLRHKYGIPGRLHRRNHEPFKVVVQDEEIEDNIADYVLLTTELKGEESPKLGVMVEEKDQGLEVKGISHYGPAKKAGLQEGDIIKVFGGQAIKSLADLKLQLFYSKIGSNVKIQINRKGQLLDKEIELFDFEQFSHSAGMMQPMNTGLK